MKTQTDVDRPANADRTMTLTVSGRPLRSQLAKYQPRLQGVSSQYQPMLSASPCHSAPLPLPFDARSGERL